MHNKSPGMENCDKLFVYGTLRNEFENEYAKFLKKHGKNLGNGYFFGQLFDVGHYPGAIYDALCTEKVFGDIILLQNDKVLHMLDAYEGVDELNPQPQEYKREMIAIFSEGKAVFCWTYLYNHPVQSLKKINSGDYLQYLSKYY
jgi:gamma-glutamylcyclotransferase (GGCT)/AIG2-like uncharacterized protein YtfP